MSSMIINKIFMTLGLLFVGTSIVGIWTTHLPVVQFVLKWCMAILGAAMLVSVIALVWSL